MMKNMSYAAKTIFIFGLYMVITGLVLLIVPEVLFNVADHPTPPDVMSRIAGMLLLLFSYMYFRSALDEVTQFFHWTVHMRPFIIVFLIVFYLLDLASPIIITFGVIDLVGALWTWWAIRKD